MTDLHKLLKIVVPTVEGNEIILKQNSVNNISLWDNTEKNQKAIDRWVKTGGGEWSLATLEDIQEFVKSKEVVSESETNTGAKTDNDYSELTAKELKAEIEKRLIEIKGNPSKPELLQILIDDDKANKE
jgi:hypothetical protein